MALVDYSDSDSDSETIQKPVVTDKPQPQQPPSTSTKKPFQKLVSSSGSAKKIVVNLPTATPDDANADERPAKRAKVAAAAGSSRFSSFGSFLPPPKKTTPAVSRNDTGDANAGGSSNKATPSRPLFSLRTGAEPAFSRAPADEDDGQVGEEEEGGGSSAPRLNLPPPKKAPSGPSIPEGQKPEEEVKLVGKPLMFKPLSVGRKPLAGKNKKTTIDSAKATGVTMTAQQPVRGEIPKEHVLPTPPPVKKKVSLFSADDGDTRPALGNAAIGTGGAYEPLLFTSTADGGKDGVLDKQTWTEDYDSLSLPAGVDGGFSAASSNGRQQQSLSSIADDLGLSEAARRELFGRQRGGQRQQQEPTAGKIVHFNMEQEYTHNEELRASGEQQVYNPVRSIAPGKHSLRQIVNMAQNNQTALEDSFAQGRSNRKDAAGRYGWK
ncbi:mitotic checkpoint regulator, MAD2B-interacting-domain-containing protein [Diplogelasinospora grovesii]|uniref:Mitotic checkpoint regulator, MAD2B-interacting-domain-containing protein n=1 Tax=Diplogelasinospora grovesii TaxID=303347 RepID=A0AAN6N4H1_9PEZI|nr:mitotic checkpoint regulator, MAD2B-interacting-domain-containing protein [Diplogelasinospora grovesii]